MAYFVCSSPLLQKKLAFLAKHNSLAHIAPTTICTPTIQMRMPAFCNFSTGIAISDFLELAKFSGSIAIDGNTLTHTFTTTASSATAQVTRTMRLHELDYNINLDSASVSIRIPKFAMLTNDEVCLTYKDDVLTVESHGYLKTGVAVPAERLDGEAGFSCKAQGRDLSIVEDLEGDLVLSFHESYLVMYGLEADSETAAIIRVLD